MSNTLITPSIIAKEALMQLENNCVAADMVHRAYKKEFVKIGDSVTIKKPVKFEANDGSDITSQIQDVTEQSTSITVDQRKNVAWQFSSQELTMNIKDYSETYIKPAMITLANKVDAAVCGLYKDVPLAAGTAGTTPSTFGALGAAAQNLDDNSVETDMRRMLLNPAANWAMADAFKNLYNQKTATPALRKGQLIDIAGFDIRMDQNVARHTAGTVTGVPLVNGAAQTGSTLEIDGLVAGTIAAGDVFTLAGVYHVNPVSKESTGKLQQFTVTADQTVTGTTASLAIYPPITTSGAYQTVDAAPADNAVLTWVADHTANLAFHKNAFALVTCPLAMPDGASFKARATHNGLSVRVIKDYDIKTDVEVIRLDIFFGTKTIYPELASRLMG